MEDDFIDRATGHKDIARSGAVATIREKQETRQNEGTRVETS